MTGKRRLQNLSKIFNPDDAAEGIHHSDAGHILKNMRDELLCARYYYHQNLTGKKLTNEILAILEREFFISPKSITLILTRSTEALKKLRKEAPTVATFRKKYPTWVW